MKVALYYNLNFGGAKRVVRDQVLELSASKIEVDIYTINSEDDAFSPDVYSNRVFSYKYETPFAKIRFLGRFLKLIYIFLYLKKLNKRIARDIDRRKYDLVVVHPDRYTQSPYLLRFLKTKSIYYCQEPYRIAYERSLRISDDIPLYSKLFENISRFILKSIDVRNVGAATLAIASSRHVRERMIEAYDIYPKVFYPGIDVSNFKERGTRKTNEILFIGSKKDPTDGYMLFKKAMEYYSKSERPKVNFITWRNQNEKRMTEIQISKMYSQSRITVCMARLETFGLTPLESMACGTPVIAFDSGGHRETVVNGKVGFLVDFDPKEIYQKINILMQDNRKFMKFSKYSRQYVLKNWTVKKRNKPLIEYYRREAANQEG